MHIPWIDIVATPARRLLFALLGASAIANASPDSGWWWNPNEPGRGYFIEMVGRQMFVSGYFYDADGRATWLVSSDPMPDAYAYEGRLLEYEGGQTLFGSYQAPSPRQVGTLGLRFSDDTHATLTWPGGTVPLQRYEYRSGASSFEARTGWWWNPAESGRGFSIEQQGERMFIGAFMYDASGNPTWYAADAKMTTPTRFVAPIDQYSGGQTLNGPHRLPGAPARVGTITVDFVDGEAAVTLNEELPGIAAPKRVKVINVRPLLEGDLPLSFEGTFSQVITFTHTNGYLEVDGNAVWERPPDLVNLTDGSSDYVLNQAKATSHFAGAIDQGDEICNVSATEQTTLSAMTGKLNVKPNGAYTGSITFNVVLHTTPCDGTLDIPYQAEVSLRGRVRGRDLRESPPVPPGDPTIATRWRFLGLY